MRRWAISLIVLVSGCEVIPQTAPITFKTTQADGVFIDGVELSVLCELAEHLGSDYRAEDVSEDDAIALEDQRVFLDFLDTDGATCGRDADPLDLPFVADPERRIVSTWNDVSTENAGDRWGSCIADSTRPSGQRVVYCEIGEGPQTERTSPDFNLTPEPEPLTPEPEVLTPSPDEPDPQGDAPASDPQGDAAALEPETPMPDLEDPASGPTNLLPEPDELSPEAGSGDSEI